MNYENIPTELKTIPQWVCWCGDKLPKNPKTGGNAQSNNPDTWGTYKEAVEAVEKFHFDGIGFMFANGYFGVDLDDCFDNIDLVNEFVNTLKSYTEISISGNGLHVICKGKLPDGARRKGKVEMYDSGRFFIMTGNSYSEVSFKIRDCTEPIKVLHAKYLRTAKPQGVLEKNLKKHKLSDADIIEKALKSRSGKTFKALYDGMWNGSYKSQSEADLAFCNHLAFWTQKDAVQMDRIFRSSALYREKWDRRQSGTTYGALTIQKAIDETGDVYTQGTLPVSKKVEKSTKRKFNPLNTISAEELQRMNLPPLYFAVEGLLPQGLSIIASPPKYGKSWLMLALCLAVAQGESFLGRNTNKSEVLYLALEDSHHRLQDRINKVLEGSKPPPNAHFSINADSLSGNLIEQLEMFLQAAPSLKLIVIDTLQKVRDCANKGETLYGHDYKELGIIKKFADEHGICVLLVHHLRKSKEDNDVFAQISGTYGIMGAVDTALTLTKAEWGNGDTILSMTGRDIEYNEEVIQFNKTRFKWSWKGTVEDIKKRQQNDKYRSNAIIRTVAKLLKDNPKGWTGTATELFNLCHETCGECPAATPANLSKTLKRLQNDMKVIDGIDYTPPPKKGAGGQRLHKFSYR